MKVFTYTEPGMASVNSYIIDTGSGVVVIDAQRSVSSGEKLAAQIRQIGQSVIALFLTHPHPDHFGGMSVLAKAFPDAPRYALAITRDAIADDTDGYIALSKQVLGDDFDTAIPVPNTVIASGDTVTLGGVAFVAHDAGVGEAACMLMLHLPDHDALFCADVVQHNMTAFLLEGHLDAWREQVTRVAEQFGNVQNVYPGHGAAGTGAELFAYQAEYLKTFSDLLAANGAATDTSKQAVVAGMNQAYPGYLPVAAIPDLLDQDVDAIQKAISQR